MLKTPYDVLTRNGREKFVVVPLSDYEALLEKLDDEADYRALLDARRANAGKPTHSLAHVKQQIRGKTRKRAVNSRA